MARIRASFSVVIFLFLSPTASLGGKGKGNQAAANQTVNFVCGGYNGEFTGEKTHRGFTMTTIDLWQGSLVEYSFVSNGDSLKDSAFFVDSKVGFSAVEMGIIRKAMKRIEAVSCIRFKRINPVPGKKWLLMMREGNSTTCYRQYIESNLRDKVVGNLGKPFSFSSWFGDCFRGAYASWLGAGSPSFMVTSMMDLTDTEGSVGLLVHELLHNLGVGHTQQRPDRDSYIIVNDINIQSDHSDNYVKCSGVDCETHDSPYDCSSIMHYRDNAFANGEGKTMTAKDPSTCDLSGYMTELTASDIELLKKMYCAESGPAISWSWG